jgi:glycosyltransferase involved in cell wall biosynthesis
VKVLQVIPGIATRYGGPSEAVLGMTRALRKQDIETLIATTDADGAGVLPVPTGVVVDFKGVPAIFFRRQWSEAFKFSRPLSRWLDAHVGEFDVVHVHAVYSHSSLAAGRASRRHGVPYVVRPLGTLDQWSRAQKPFRKWVMWQLLARSLMHRAAAVHYTSRAEQTEVETGLGLRRGMVIPLSVAGDALGAAEDEARFRATLSDLGQRPYVLALCRIHPVKALEGLVDAFVASTDTAELRDWRLVIAGSGDAAYVDSLEERVRARRAEGRVILPGWIEGSTKAGALRGAGLFALASQHENFGVAVAEAMLQRVPVLVSQQVNIAPEITAAGAGWVTSLDQSTLTRTLGEALRDADERTRRGEAGRRLAEMRFTESRMGDALVQLYRSIMLPAEVRDVVPRVLS